ncbi:MAG: HAMP domain-containing histidine kinase [Deltaproteobacteria bacterium]|nr:HAMP domain-containing histidine kinase [Deltaproteobacteria bacterium]
MEAGRQPLLEALLSDEHGIATLLVARAGSLIDANAAARRLLGLSASAAGQPTPALFAGQSRQKLERILAGASACAVELQVGAAPAEPLAVRFLALPVERGEWALLACGAGVDYTESLVRRLLQANDQLVDQARELSQRTEEVERARQRLETLGKLREAFLAAVSHDLRSPLAAVKLLATRLESPRPGTTAEELRSSAARIYRSATRMERLIANLLTAAQLEEGAMPLRRQRLALTQVAREVVEVIEPLAVEQARSITVERGRGPDAVWGDEVRLFEVLSNLVSNALRYAPRGTRVVVSVEGDGETVRCTVTDRGPGVPAEQRPQLFERFRSFGERAGAAGLGLYICKQIVELHGGRIWVEDPPGGGARFVVELGAAGPGR